MQERPPSGGRFVCGVRESSPARARAHISTPRVQSVFVINATAMPFIPKRARVNLRDTQGLKRSRAMKPHPSLLLATVIALAMATGSASADTLLKERAARAKSATLPAGGVTMSEVEGQYGEPTERKDPVGKPPITRWIYPAFTVYFENDRVISAVLNKSSELEEGPKPAPPQKPNR
jgi:hypothetical protein